MSDEFDILSPQDDEPLGIFDGPNAKYARMAIAALGSIPWIGGFLAATAALDAEKEQGKVNRTLERWIGEHELKIHELRNSLNAIANRIEALGADAQLRVEEEGYLLLVRKAFKSWDGAETQEKREYVQRLVTNAAGTKVSEYDVVRLFLDWIDFYHEAHFAIMRAIYNKKGITRLDIWREISNDSKPPREDSSEADLFRMLIGDLSTGRVIRQERQTDSSGKFLKKPTKSKGSKSPPNPYMTSSFDDKDGYELSELGQEFIHYVLQDTVSHIE